MKNIVLSFIFSFTLYSMSIAQLVPAILEPYDSTKSELHKEIIKMDSIFFNAYNTCDLKLQESMYSNELEFFHDKDGLSTSKKEILENTKNNICGKVSRKLIKPTVQVYPINNYGAIEIGTHMFHNMLDTKIPASPTKFIIMWKKTGHEWKITKVISLH